jgi:hypothetical protein
VFLGLDTFFAPLYVAYGHALCGNDSIYVYLSGYFSFRRSRGPCCRPTPPDIRHDETATMDSVLARVRKLRGSQALEDDFTIVEAVYAPTGTLSTH